MTHRNGLAATPPMGWNSYDCFGGEVTEAEVRANSAWMAEHLLDVGWEYIVIDIGWHVARRDAAFDAKGRSCAGRETEIDAHGRLLPAPDRFTSAADGHGFKPLADHVHSLGLKFGIHVLPGVPEPAIANGTRIEGTDIALADAVYADQYNKLATNFLRRVDHTTPGGQAYVDSLLRLYAQWDVDFIKLDGIGLPYMPDVVEAFDEARTKVDRDIVLSVSACHHDYNNYRKHRARHCEMWRVSEDLWDRWEHLEMMLYTMPNWHGCGGPGHWPDADMLPLGRIGIRQHPLNSPDRMTRLTRPEQRAMMSLWCIAQSPLMFGGDMPSNDDWTLSLLNNRDVIAVNQHGRNSRELFKDCNQSASVWRCDMPEADTWTIGLFSFAPRDRRRIEVRFDEAELPSRVRVHDLWENADLGVFEHTFAAEIDPHGGGLFRIRPA